MIRGTTKYETKHRTYSWTCSHHADPRLRQQEALLLTDPGSVCIAIWWIKTKTQQKHVTVVNIMIINLFRNKELHCEARDNKNVYTSQMKKIQQKIIKNMNQKKHAVPLLYIMLVLQYCCFTDRKYPINELWNIMKFILTGATRKSIKNFCVK